jgi:hypothetical protein
MLQDTAQAQLRRLSDQGHLRGHDTAGAQLSLPTQGAGAIFTKWRSGPGMGPAFDGHHRIAVARSRRAAGLGEHH